MNESIITWLNRHGAVALPLRDGRVGLVIGSYIVPISASTKPLDHFTSAQIISDARRQMTETLALSQALGQPVVTQLKPAPVEEHEPAPFIATTVAEEADYEPELFDMNTTKPWLSRVQGLASGTSNDKVEGWDNGDQAGHR